MTTPYPPATRSNRCEICAKYSCIDGVISCSDNVRPIGTNPGQWDFATSCSRFVCDAEFSDEYYGNENQ